MERIGSALRGLRYGSVHVVVQDGKIVQIERTEKFRLPRPPDRVPERAP
ncbi:MAG: YezD family protein [Alphaproteobacteria bacterium]